ncbi:MAG: hypothetical protein MUO33_05735 [Sedimentisphaerales bacterium]|nr:hypothetical protein [Sedimentisphaerales bacterium]
MNVTLDGQNLFDRQQLEVEPDSISRACVEKAVSGLDGLLSIDLGTRSRKIRQTGTLRAQSRSQMQDRIDVISAYMDGDTHTLEIGGEQTFENIRLDVFKVTDERVSGGGLEVDYEIVYTQLA